MKIDLTSEELLYILDSIHGNYIDSKAYFNKCTDEVDKIGITNPMELKELYNNLLGQAQQQGEYKFLDKIR